MGCPVPQLSAILTAQIQVPVHVDALPNPALPVDDVDPLVQALSDRCASAFFT